MTTLCGGGASEAKPDVVGFLSIGSGAIEAFIDTVLGFPEIAPLLAPIIAGLVYIDVVNYCSTDPPADPGLTPLDVANALKIPPDGTTFPAQQKVLTWFESQYWWQVCQCSTVTTPTPPAPSNPGPASSNPGLPANSATPCWNVTVPWAAPARSPTTGLSYADLTSVALPPGPYYSGEIASSPTVVNNQFVALPADISRLAMTITLDQPVHGSGLYVQAQWEVAQDIPPTIIGEIFDVIMIPVGTSTPFATLTAYPSFAKLSGIVVTNGDDIAHSGTLNVQFFCTATVVGQQPCCAPDPLLEGELQQILQYVQAIYAGLPVSPNSFAEGTVHAGLSGAGSVTFSAIPIAIKIQLTTIPPWVGLHIGNPDFYFDVGFLSFATSEGNYAQQRIQFATQVLSVPILAGSVGYTLYDGVVASITELTPGP